MGRDDHVAGRSPSQIADNRGFQIDGGRHRVTVLTATEDRKSVSMGGLTLAVSGRRPNETFQVQQHPQAYGGHEHDLVRCCSILVLSSDGKAWGLAVTDGL